MSLKIFILLGMLLIAAVAVDYDHQAEDDDDTPQEVPNYTSLRKATKEELNEERGNSMDKQIVYLIFRTPYVKEKGIIKLVNEFN